MAIRNIVKIGDDILRKVCRTQLNFDERLATVLDDMADTMYKAEGVGLAAPQVGILRRYCIVDVGDGIIELINPVIDKESGSQEGRFTRRTETESPLSLQPRVLRQGQSATK